MRNLKFLTHPVIVVFTAFAFLFLVTGCEKAVTYYDNDGKPYTVKEPDPWGSIGAIILTMLILGAIAAGASSDGGGASLYRQGRPMFAYAGNRGYITDASSGVYSSVKCFKLVDAEGNLISRHVIDVDRLLACKTIMNVSDFQISAKVNKRMLRKLVSEIAKANNLSSVPDSIKTNISCFSDEENILRVDNVSIPENKDPESKVSELTVMSEKGIYRVTTTLPSVSESQKYNSEQLSVTVSKLN